MTTEIVRKAKGPATMLDDLVLRSNHFREHGCAVVGCLRRNAYAYSVDLRMVGSAVQAAPAEPPRASVGLFRFAVILLAKRAGFACRHDLVFRQALEIRHFDVQGSDVRVRTRSKKRRDHEPQPAIPLKQRN